MLTLGRTTSARAPNPVAVVVIIDNDSEPKGFESLGLPNQLPRVVRLGNCASTTLVDAQGDDQSDGEQEYAEQDRGLQAHQDLQESDRE